MQRIGRMQRVLVATCLVIAPTVAVGSAPPVTEREKFEAEQAFRNRQFVADQAYRNSQQEQSRLDLELRREQQALDRWFSPLVLAIIGATIAAIAQIYVASKNSRNQLATEEARALAMRTIEKEKAEAQIALEDRKARAQRDLDLQQAESNRILEAVKTGGNTEAAAANLDFLLKAGLVTSSTLAGRMTEWLATRKEGEGPSLPSVDGVFHFARKGRLPKEAQAAVETSLKKFLSYLDELGFERGRKSVRIQSIDDGPSYYVAGNMVLGPSDRFDPRAACRLYAHHVLSAVPGFKDQGIEVQGIELGLAAYFPSSFLDEPHPGQLMRHDTKNTYSSLAKAGEIEWDDSYRDGGIWNGLFWWIRTIIGAQIADRLLCAAWVDVVWPNDGPNQRDAFLKSLLDAAIVTGVGDTVRGILSEWRFQT